MESDYYNQKESVDQYIEMAKDVDGAFLIEELEEFLPHGAKVLEIGSGPGTDWKLLSELYHVTGSDYSPEFLRRLREQHPEATFLELDARTLETDLVFDCIFSNKVLHHLSDAELDASLKRQYDMLPRGGMVAHSFWKGDSTEFYNGMRVQHYHEQGLMAIFRKYFWVSLVMKYPEFEEDDSIFILGAKA